MNIRAKFVMIGFLTSLATLVLLASLSAPAYAQFQKPALPALSRPMVNPDDDNRPTESIENEYLKVEINERGQFGIQTTGGDPDVIGDENKVLLYNGTIPAPAIPWDGDTEIWGTSFATFREYKTPLNRWSEQANNEPTTGTRLNSATSDKLTTRYLVDNICAFIVTQSLSFMKNPYTNREDMVRIEYELTRATDLYPTECTEPRHSGRVGVRLLLDTMIGANDQAPFFVPGLGTTSNQHEFKNESIPPFLRVFEDSNFAPDSLQAMIHILRREPSITRPNPDRFVIAKWGSIYKRDDHLAPFDGALLWDYVVPEETPHEDSAIAIYWSDHTIGSTRSSNPIWLSFGYGLAPQGGGASWIDAPAVLQDGNLFESFSWINNATDETYSNGIVSISLPTGVELAEEAMIASVNSPVQEIGDLEPGETAQVSWNLRVTGGPGVYSYTTTAAFDSGQSFNSIGEVAVEQGLKYANTSYSVNEDAGTVQITITRTNPNGEPVTVDYALTSDTATSGTDFNADGGTLSFAANSTAQTFTINILDDSEIEENETFFLSLHNPSANAALIEQEQVIVTIVDDDGASQDQQLYLPTVMQ
jgi:hypothetical protein